MFHRFLADKDMSKFDQLVQDSHLQNNEADQNLSDVGDTSDLNELDAYDDLNTYDELDGVDTYDELDGVDTYDELDAVDTYDELDGVDAYNQYDINSPQPVEQSTLQHNPPTRIPTLNLNKSEQRSTPKVKSPNITETKLEPQMATDLQTRDDVDDRNTPTQTRDDVGDRDNVSDANEPRDTAEFKIVEIQVGEKDVTKPDNITVNAEPPMYKSSLSPETTHSEILSKEATIVNSTMNVDGEIRYNEPLVVSYTELERMCDKMSQATFGAGNYTPTEDGSTMPPKSASAIDYQAADVIRQLLIDDIYKILRLYVDWIRLRAQDMMKPLLQSDIYLPLGPMFSETLHQFTQNTEVIDADHTRYTYTAEQIETLMKNMLQSTLNRPDIPQWMQYRDELNYLIPQKATAIQELTTQLSQSIQRALPEHSVSIWLAQAMHNTLNQRESNLQTDIQMVAQVYESQHHLLSKCIQTYTTFYDMLLSHWQRNIDELTQKSQQSLNKIHQMFTTHHTTTPIEALVHSYEAYLQKRQAIIPWEMKISAHPRKNWKHYLSTHQPHECIRVIQAELNMILDQFATRPVDYPEIRQEIEQWKREFAQYDWQKVKKSTDQKLLLQRQMEDIVEVETRRLCLTRWQNLVQQVYDLGLGVHAEITRHLSVINQQYQQNQRTTVWQNTQTYAQMVHYKSQLALQHSQWALDLENREHMITDLYLLKYRLLSVNGIAEVLSLVRQLARV